MIETMDACVVLIDEFLSFVKFAVIHEQFYYVFYFHNLNTNFDLKVLGNSWKFLEILPTHVKFLYKLLFLGVGENLIP